MGNFMSNVGEFMDNLKAELYEEAPTIAIVTGCIGMTVAAVWACKKTLELPQTLEKAKADIQEVKDIVPVEDKEYKKALAVAYGHATLDICKLYVGPVAVGGLAIASVTAGTIEGRKRNAALTATVTTLEGMYERYRKNVRERYGDQVDLEMKYGLKHETVTETVVDENGKKKKIKQDILVMPDGNKFDVNTEYARIWEAGCSDYFDKGSREYNMHFLKDTQRNANRILKKKGYLFLNEVYEMLGFAPTEAGQRVGWIYDPNKKIVDGEYMGDNEVDFGINTVNCPGNKDFINGFQPYILLDFNVDGDIAKDALFIRNYKFRNE